MRYRIAYDEPGRLRVRFGPDAFTQEQGYGIAALLLGRPGVREAVTCALNGSVLVCYEGQDAAHALHACFDLPLVVGGAVLPQEELQHVAWNRRVALHELYQVLAHNVSREHVVEFLV